MLLEAIFVCKITYTKKEEKERERERLGFMVDTVMAKTDLARGCSSGEFIESLFLARSNVLNVQAHQGRVPTRFVTFNHGTILWDDRFLA